MRRYLCWLAVFAVVALPDWATACRPLLGRWHARPVYCAPVPVQCAPAYPVYPPPVYAYPPANPTPVRPMNPPRIEPSPRDATPTPAPAPKSGGTGAADPGSAKPPATGNVRPTAGSDTGVSPMPPKDRDTAPPKNPDVKKTEPKAEPKAAPPDPLPKFPEVDIPKNLGPLPKLEVPKEPESRPAPKGAASDPPKKSTPSAVPDPAPAPKPSVVEPPDASELKLPPLPTPGGGAAPAPAFPEPLIPSPSVPEIPDPSKRESLPPLSLPPDVPVKKESTSKSSPLTGGARELSVSVFPAGSTERPAGGYRTVGFYNHTARDLNLTIEGRAVKLPAHSYLYAQLAASFTWGRADQTPTRQTVPAGAAGVDVVFRD